MINSLENAVVDVSFVSTIQIDGVNFSVDLLRQLIPENDDEERTWEITESSGIKHRGKLRRSGCVVVVTLKQDDANG